ncbi:MAG: TIGR00725 family protein [Prolixibacteraceae bacterium]|nr:TIGR00725 family protein [Prolixibacteraceae bacterium]
MKPAKPISIIGPNANKCTDEMYRFGLELGKAMAEAGYIIVCGGMYGIMEAVCKSAREAGTGREVNSIGIIPGSDKTEANSYCDLVIPTGMGIARNVLVVNSGDAVVAVAGGSGTLSELAMAWQLGKKVICYTGFEGWARELAGKGLDSIERPSFLYASTIEEILSLLK